MGYKKQCQFHGVVNERHVYSFFLFQSRSLIARELRDALVRLPLRSSAIRRRLNSDGGSKPSTESYLNQYPPPIGDPHLS